MKFFLIIIIQLGFSQMLIAQKTIFADTVSFDYFVLGPNNDLRSGEINNPDTIRNTTKVFLEKSGVVNWLEFPVAGDTENLKEFNIKSFDSNGFHYRFKIVKSETGFHYESLDNTKTTLFKASFNSKDTINDIPFFCYRRFFFNERLDNYKMVYLKDTTISYRGLNVPCYLYIKQNNDIGNGAEIFTVDYTECYIEKQSLLPVRLSYRMFIRTIAGTNEDWTPRYMLGYSRHTLQLR